MSSEAVAPPRVTAAVVSTVTGPSLAFTATAVDRLTFNLNLSQISQGLHVPASLIGFLGSAATLVTAAAVLTVGNFGDIFGLKRLLTYGLIAYILVGLLTALSPDYWFLLAMRFLDGLALAVPLGLALAVLKVSVPPQIRPAAIGIFMAISTVLYGVSPLIGGWVTETFGWRWLFLIAPALALVALVLIDRYATAPPRHLKRRIDGIGVSLFGAALLGLVYGVGAAQNGLGRPQAWVPLACSGVLGAAFVCHERRTRDPALDLAMFARPAFAIAALAMLTSNFFTAGFGVVLGQFGSAVLSLPPQTIGLLYLPGSVLIASASILAGRLVSRYSARPVLIMALLVLVSSGLVMAITASPTMAVWVLVIATWLGNLGSFLVSTPSSETILSSAPPGKTGAVASAQQTFAMTGYALGPTVYLLLLSLFFQRQWLADAQSRGISAQQAQHAVDAVTSSMATSPGTSAYDPNLVQLVSGLNLPLDYTHGLRLTMLVITLVLLTVTVLTCFLMPRRPRTAP